MIIKQLGNLMQQTEHKPNRYWCTIGVVGIFNDNMSRLLQIGGSLSINIREV